MGKTFICRCEAKRMQELLTPLSIIVGLQLTALLYVLEKGWMDIISLGLTSFGLLFAWGALLWVVRFGILDPWKSKDERIPLDQMRATREKISWFTQASLVFFGLTLLEIVLRAIFDF
ncbi:MAG: hypothetical protein ACE5OZ_12835 [Candidatus Heimdallarchaeota archaeon]